ncbi:Ammonium transporter 1 member 2 [Camellia lanceoleosa]|uniref:Ammonium transporter 1 member 2 n=1 Tax=Camellia lanceoleosa TaxID=1840588 RepID=A0ACC0H7W6_9ERIC|nr:Ammonium transporter 1 member 2 [Camellia lanceoleosa]
MVGGIARLGSPNRRPKNRPIRPSAGSVALRGHGRFVVLGSFLLRFGGTGSTGSFLTIPKSCRSPRLITGNGAPRRTLTTTLVGAYRLTTLFGKRLLDGHRNVVDVCNGLLGVLPRSPRGVRLVEPYVQSCGFVVTGF